MATDTDNEQMNVTNISQAKQAATMKMEKVPAFLCVDSYLLQQDELLFHSETVCFFSSPFWKNWLNANNKTPLQKKKHGKESGLFIYLVFFLNSGKQNKSM